METDPSPETRIAIVSASGVTSECQECRSEKSIARKYHRRLIVGLSLPATISYLDLTIVATALPIITDHYARLGQRDWIVTAFILTSTTFIPAFGQLADVFGRHAVLRTVPIIQLVGSALRAAANSLRLFLFGRAVQGLSCAGLLNTIEIILADEASLRESAVNYSIFTVVAGVGFGVDPTLGIVRITALWRTTQDGHLDSTENVTEGFYMLQKLGQDARVPVGTPNWRRVPSHASDSG